MKKVILSALFTIGFGIYGFATNKIEIQLDNYQKEETPTVKKKTESYDYCLFKFMLVPLKKTETDTLKKKEDQLKKKMPSEETAHHQEKPLDFFMFSYAS